MASSTRKQPATSSKALSAANEAPKPLEDADPEDNIASYIPSNLGRMVIPYHGDFCISGLFHPQLVVQLMAEGFLPMAAKTAPSVRDGKWSSSYLLLPKLHERRSVVPLNPQSALHVSRSVRKKAKQYSLTLNTSWDQVVEYCRQQHGSSCWLYPPLVEAYLAIHGQPMQATVTNDTISSNQPQSSSLVQPTKVLVRMYSVELWDNRTNELVAGELGYTVGGFMYTSLTGFTRQDSAGSVQLAAWGRFLQQKQFAIWDLGMDMAYKRQLGAQQWPRRDFVNFVHTHRSMPCTTSSTSTNRVDGISHNWLANSLQQPVNCQQILQQAEATVSLSAAIPSGAEEKQPTQQTQQPKSTATADAEAPFNGDIKHKNQAANANKRSKSSTSTTNAARDACTFGSATVH
jgi:Leu/Phe-tRNA-protein transferase